MTPHLSTREAARLLRVSEASVRRWSDAGVLRADRVGRRNERRFAEADLQEFVDRGGPAQRIRPAAVNMSIRGANVRTPCHLASFYNSDAGRLSLAVPFLSDGMRLGQPCFLVARDTDLSAFGAAFGSLGRDLERDIAEGRLILMPSVGETAIEALALWELAWGRALHRLPPPIRVVADMIAEMDRFDDLAELLRYEQQFDQFSRRFPVAVLCQYDVREFDGPTILGAMKSHPDLYDVGLGTFLV